MPYSERERVEIYRGDGFRVYAFAEREIGPRTFEGAELLLEPDEGVVWLDAGDVLMLVAALSQWLAGQRVRE